MRFLLDTDHVTIIQYGAGLAYSAIKGHAARYPPGEVAHSVISLQEQLAGALASIQGSRRPVGVVRGYERLGRILNYYAGETVLPFDAAAAAEFDRIRSGGAYRVGTMDLRIASIALSRGLTLLTRNTRDFGRISGLGTADWTV